MVQKYWKEGEVFFKGVSSISIFPPLNHHDGTSPSSIQHTYGTFDLVDILEELLFEIGFIEQILYVGPH